MVVNELRGEKIDIVPFSEDFQDFVAKALSPAKVSQVIVSDDGTQADVIVPDHQLSLAIGREGQNARLAARLTGVRIDIRSETQLAEGVPPRRDELDDGVEYEEGQWVTNAETGEMEWHAADGSVISEAEWNAQAAAAAEPAGRPRRPRPCAGRAAETEDRRDDRTVSRSTGRGRRVRRRRRGRRPADVEASRVRTNPRLPSDRPGPERTCIGCRQRRSQAALVRCVLTDDGRAVVDRTGPGRGAWLCIPPSDCFELAVRRKAFERAWRRPVGREALDELAAWTARRRRGAT